MVMYMSTKEIPLIALNISDDCSRFIFITKKAKSEYFHSYIVKDSIPSK